VLPCGRASNRHANSRAKLACNVPPLDRMKHPSRASSPATRSSIAHGTPRALLLGAAAGAGATIAMSGVMLVAQRAGLLGRSPPRHIVERTLGWLGLRHETSRNERQLLTAVAHLGFGATQGALYAVIEQRLGRRSQRSSGLRPRKPSATTGVPFGLLVWAASYVGWIPALGILPRPSRDRPGRPTSMVLAHVVYGAALATLLRKLQHTPVRDYSMTGETFETFRGPV